MNLKKDENKIKKIGFSIFKKFIWSKKNFYLHKKRNFSNQTKVILIFSLIFISLKTNKSFWKLDKNFLHEVYLVFSSLKKEEIKDRLISILSDQIRKFNLGSEIKSLNLEKLYDNLLSFYENSSILNWFNGSEKLKKAKLKKIQVNEDNLASFITLNKNLKFIMTFIKISTPKQFNFIYQKLMYLT